MFKNVEYAGFDGHPELKSLADRAVAMLASIVRDWDVRIAIELEAYADQPEGVEIAATLELPAASGKGSRFLTRNELENTELLESRCRAIWGRTMDGYIERRKPVWDEIVNQPAEV